MTHGNLLNTFQDTYNEPRGKNDTGVQDEFPIPYVSYDHEETGRRNMKEKLNRTSATTNLGLFSLPLVMNLKHIYVCMFLFAHMEERLLGWIRMGCQAPFFRTVGSPE